MNDDIELDITEVIDSIPDSDVLFGYAEPDEDNEDEVWYA